MLERAGECNSTQDELSDADVLRAARFLIDRHGPRAALHAEIRARDLKTMQEEGAARIWTRICAAIRTLQSGDR